MRKLVAVLAFLVVAPVLAQPSSVVPGIPNVSVYINALGTTFSIPTEGTAATDSSFTAQDYEQLCMIWPSNFMHVAMLPVVDPVVLPTSGKGTILVGAGAGGVWIRVPPNFNLFWASEASTHESGLSCW